MSDDTGHTHIPQPSITRPPLHPLVEAASAHIAVPVGDGVALAEALGKLDAVLTEALRDAERWRYMYENDMTGAYADHIELMNYEQATGKPHGSLFRGVVDAAMKERG